MYGIYYIFLPLYGWNFAKQKIRNQKSMEYGKRRHFVTKCSFPCRPCLFPKNFISFMLIVITENIMWSNKLEKHYVLKDCKTFQHLYVKIQMNLQDWGLLCYPKSSFPYSCYLLDNRNSKTRSSVKCRPSFFFYNCDLSFSMQPNFIPVPIL